MPPAVLPKWYPAWFRLVFLACLSCLAGFPLLAAEPVVAKEQQLKAAFLFNFTKFVEWPAGKFADANAPIRIGVLGSSSFGTAVAEAIKDRKVNGRELRFVPVNTVAEIKGLHALFVGVGEGEKLAGLGAALTAGCVLGVGESESFLRQGGTILLALEGDKVRFEIDLNCAERAHLKISAQLLKLARAVRK